MNTPDRTIFRTEAVQRYWHQRKSAVLPRFITPPVVLFLWVLLGTLIAVGWITWVAQVPMFESGVAVVSADEVNEIGLIVLLPPESLTRLQPGQVVWIQLHEVDVPMQQTVLSAVAPAISNPDEVQARFNLRDGAAAAVTEPVVVALAPFPPDNFGQNTYTGAVLPVKVESGSRRIISLLPVIGNYFSGATGS